MTGRTKLALLRSFIELLLGLWLTATIVFILTRILNGDPAAVMAGMEAKPEDIATIRHSLGLDTSLPAQYIGWLGAIIRGDFGQSWYFHENAADLIFHRLGLTLSLAVLALLLSWLIALPGGIIGARRKGSATDRLMQAGNYLFLALPEFWVALLLLLLFGVGLHWIGLFGIASPLSLVVAALSLALGRGALLARSLRASLLEESGKDYVLSLRLLGLPSRRLFSRHLLPNALRPLIVLSGIQFGYLLGGAVIVEQVFSLPGLGKLLLQALEHRDLPLVQAGVMVSSACFMFSSFLADWAGRILDPRQDQRQ